MSPLATRLGEAVPLGQRGTITAGLGTVVFFIPVYGLVPSTFSEVAVAYGMNGRPADALGAFMAAGLAPFLVSRYRLLRSRVPETKPAAFRGLNIGPVKVTEEDMFTSILVLGATGTGKTSRILFPALEDLMNTYSAEDEDIYSKNPYQKCGGFLLEVKGKFFETAVLLAHKSGRNAASDVRVIRANSTLPVVEFRDEQGRRFFVNGQPCSTGSEAARLYQSYRFQDGLPIISKLFKRINSDTLQTREEELRRIEVKVHDDIRFIGWRWRDKKLHRVSRTLKRSTPEFTGQVIDPPRTLKYLRTLYLSNGLQYNLLDPNIPSSEAAERIAMVAKMVSGEGKGGGDNAYFYQAAGKVIDCAIRLQRIIEPKRQCTVLDVYRIVAQDTAMSAGLQKLSAHAAALQQRKNVCDKEGDKDTAYELSKKITSYDDLAKFFTEEWLKLKAGNTGTSIMSTISNLFGPFMRDPSLQETFCNPATFNFDDCMQKGVIFAFVPGPEYEMNARLIGTVLKMDFQSRMLQRVSEGSDSLNKNRIVLHVADECQKFIIAGSQEAGDPNFMSLSRESKVINFAATQSEAWVYSAISHNEARVWCQSYGTRVWLTQTDEETNKHASVLCGVITKEKRSHTEELNVGDLVVGKGGRASQKVGYEEKQRFEAHEFTELKDDEAICFNKGKGLLNETNCKSMKGKIPWRWITAPEGNAEIADRMRWWFCETWENDIFNSGRASLLDPLPTTAGDAKAPAAPTHPANGSTPSTPAGGGPAQAVAPADLGAEVSGPTAESPSPAALLQAVQNAAATQPLAPNFQAGTPLLNLGLRDETHQERAAKPVHPGETPRQESAVVEADKKVRNPDTITPAAIAKQEKAYQELLEANPFLLVEYRDVAGLEHARAHAKQKRNVPAEEQSVVGQSGIIGGNSAVIRQVNTTEGSAHNDPYRVPVDLAAADPVANLARRTVDTLNGHIAAPEPVKLAAQTTRSAWGSY